MRTVLLILLSLMASRHCVAQSGPVRAESGMVVSQDRIASDVGAKVLKQGGNAVDAAVATALALAVTHPAAGNIGGGGFLVLRPAEGPPVAYDFREMAPAKAHPKMWLVDGQYDSQRHHQSHLAVGVPGTVAGLHLAWSEQGSLPWPTLVAPAIQLAEEGFVVSDWLAGSLRGVLGRMRRYPASYAKFTNGGRAYGAGEIFKQPDLAKTLRRIAESGPQGFYSGETAQLIAKEMEANGGIITLEDLAAYTAKRRKPVTGKYRGYDIISMPPPSSGGIAIIQMLNMLESHDLKSAGFGSAENLHRYAEVMRRAFADRARYLGDPDRNPDLPVSRLISKEYAQQLNATIDPGRASQSDPASFEWSAESEETTHLSVVDKQRNAVSLTYTLEYSYGSAIVVPGGGFLLNNEMGDFNAGPGITTSTGLIGTQPNLAEPGKRMLSSMSPSIVAKDGKLVMVTGSPGGRTIINTVLQTIVNVIDHGMDAQQAVDAARVHHQWLPDRLTVERGRFAAFTLTQLRRMGHTIGTRAGQGSAQVIVVTDDGKILNGAPDRRAPDSAAVGH